MPKVLIVDDHAFIRRGIQAILNAAPEWDLCGEAENGVAAIRLARELKPDIIIMDVAMPELNGMEATRTIHQLHPNIKIVLLTLHEIARVGAQRVSCRRARLPAEIGSGALFATGPKDCRWRRNVHQPKG